MNLWENLEIYKNKTSNKLRDGQIQIRTKMIIFLNFLT